MNTFTSVDFQYRELVQKILTFGTVKKDRTGVGTKSIFGCNMRFNLQDGFPILGLKTTHFKSIVHELLWMLNSVDTKYQQFGASNIKYLVDNNVKIWNEWAYERYKRDCIDTNYLVAVGAAPKGYGNNIDVSYRPMTMPEYVAKVKADDDFAAKYGDLGAIYGVQWRFWEGKYKTEVDQIANLINDLKNNPDSRRMMVTAWNPAEIEDMALPPCHYGFQMYTRELSLQERLLYYWKISNPLLARMVILNPDYVLTQEETDALTQEMGRLGIPTRAASMRYQQRSVDTILGLPFNIASYSLLLSMICNVVNMIPEDLIVETGDTHIYLNHLEDIKEFINRPITDMPQLQINPNVSNISDYRYEDFELIGYNPHPAVKFDVAV